MTEQFQRCTKCGVDRHIDHFSSKTGKRTVKVCSKCRDVRKTRYERVEKNIEKYLGPNGREICLVESVDKDKLNYLIANHTKFNIGKSFVNGKLIDGTAQLTLLAEYHNNLNMSGEMRVRYKQKSYGFGRYYGDHSLQLQNISRPIRHTISKEKLIDIDISNAHPTFLRWYCEMNKIECGGLVYYIDNREECLAEIVELTGKPRDECKADLLAIINGRKKYEEQVQNYPQWFFDYYFNIQDIRKEVCRLEPEYYKTAKKNKQGKGNVCYNVEGTTINYLMMALENTALLAMYDVCIEQGIQVASLVYDGMMIYRSSAPTDLGELFRLMVCRIAIVLSGCVVKITEKVMDEGFDIDDEVFEFVPEDLSSYIQRDPDLDVAFNLYETSFFKIKHIDTSVKYVQDLDFTDERVIAVNSAMGSGKTTAVCRWIKENEPKRVAVLSPRISYAKSICVEYNEKIGLEGGDRFKCYKGVSKDEIRSIDRLVISMESLHKIESNYFETNPFDLVVIDECQANLSSHVCKATNGSHFDNNADVFYRMINKGKRVVFMDAFINAKTIEFVSEMSMPVVCYNYRRPMDRRFATIVKTPGRSFDSLLPFIEDDLRADKRLYIVMSSAKRAEEWATTFRQLFPDKKFKVYCKGEGKDIDDVRAEWVQYDCIFTTTTITVGINFDLLHFHRCYMSFSSASHNKVVDLFQAHYRVRHLIDNEIVVHIADMPDGDVSRVKKFCKESYVCDNLQWFEDNLIEMFNLFERAPVYLKKILCYDQLESNLSSFKLSAFVHSFLQACNYEIKIIECDDDEASQKKERSSTGLEIPDFGSIELCTKAECVSLDLRRCKGGGLSEEEKWKLEKFKFVELFTDGHPESWVDNGTDNDIWRLHYQAKRTKLYNIRLEKAINAQAKTFNDAYMKCYDKNRLALMTSKIPVRVQKMMGFLQDLGLDMSQKVGCEIPKERLNLWCSNAKTQYSDIKTLFNIRDRRKEKGSPTSTDCINLLNSIFKTYGYTQITQKAKYIKVDGKKARDPNAPYIVEDFKSHLRANDLSPEVGQRIYDTLIVETQADSRQLLRRSLAKPTVLDCSVGGYDFFS
jgi:hypothetical protein